MALDDAHASSSRYYISMRQEVVKTTADNVPGVQIVVSLINGLGHLFHASRIVLLINGYQLLRELIEQLDLMLVLVQVRVERLKEERNEVKGEDDRCRGGKLIRVRLRIKLKVTAVPR